MKPERKGPYREKQYPGRGTGAWVENPREIQRANTAYFGGHNNPRNTDSHLIEMTRDNGQIYSNSYGDGRGPMAPVPFVETRPIPENMRLVQQPPDAMNDGLERPMGFPGTLPANAGPSPISGPPNEVAMAPGLPGEQTERGQMLRTGRPGQMPLAPVSPVDLEELAKFGLPPNAMPGAVPSRKKG